MTTTINPSHLELAAQKHAEWLEMLRLRAVVAVSMFTPREEWKETMRMLGLIEVNDE